MKCSLVQKWVIGAGYHRGCFRNIWCRWTNFWDNQIHSTSTGIKKKAVEEWLTDYHKHSREFGKIIRDVWMSQARFATCQYRNGRFECDRATEPSGENVGLARTHLVLGYPTTWELYRKAVAHSTETCNSIEKIINSFEEKIISVIDVKNTEYNLHRRGIGYSPKKCDDLHYYVDEHVFETVFESIEEIIANKLLQQMTTEHGEFNIGGSMCSYNSLKWRVVGLGSGTNEEIVDLKTRIENLINDSVVSFVDQYNERIEKLQNSELKKSYREAIRNIWTGIHDNGEMLRAAGSCENVKECRPRP